MSKLSANFFSKEFECRCCGEIKVSPVLVVGLQKLRDAIGCPITILSGYRCEKHNTEIGGAKSSQHLVGKAADITAKIPILNLLEAAQNIEEFKGIGKYKDFVHVDVREKPAFWIG